MDLSGAAVQLDGTEYGEGHDVDRLYKAMREVCVNKDVLDMDLWKEWKQHGPVYDMPNHCICGVAITHCFTMKNILNGVELYPIGCKCIRKAIGEFYRCQDCRERFIDIERGALKRRMEQNDDWICPNCVKKRKHKIKEYELKLNRLEKENSRKRLNGVSFKDKDERYYKWASSLENPVGKLVEFIDYYELKQFYNEMIDKYDSHAWAWNWNLNACSKIK